jgi:hypothetical protein
MSISIAILPQIKSIKTLTTSEKKVASEITRFTTQNKWFFKSLDNFSKELEIKKGSLKNIYVKFTKLGWLGRERNGKSFEYEMTKKFFDFVENYEPKNKHIFANFSNKKMTELLPNYDRLMTDKLPINDPIISKSPTSSSVEAPQQVANILNNECIKDLRNEGENKKSIIDNQVPKQDLNNQERLNINSLSDFLGLSQIEKEDMDIFRSLNTLILFLSGKGLVVEDLEKIKANLKQEEFAKNRFSKKHWGGWINDYQTQKTEEKLKQFTITQDPNYGKTGISYSYYLYHWNKGEMPEETTQEFLSNYFFN